MELIAGLEDVGFELPDNASVGKSLLTAVVDDTTMSGLVCFRKFYCHRYKVSWGDADQVVGDVTVVAVLKSKMTSSESCRGGEKLTFPK